MDVEAVREILRGLGAGEGDDLGQALELVGEEAGQRRPGPAEAVGLGRDPIGQRRGAAGDRGRASTARRRGRPAAGQRSSAPARSCGSRTRQPSEPGAGTVRSASGAPAAAWSRMSDRA